ncbi:MAG TPA: PhoU domain-containing protein [Terriglobales bacterium]|nr:PhoU domain-containing protein [Terriglobales bacterium]
MSSALAKNLSNSAYDQILQRTLHAIDVAKSAAGASAEGIASGSSNMLDRVRGFEDELDNIDRELNEAVTSTVAQITDENQTRELLACLKFILELERIGDLLLNFANRAAVVGKRLDSADTNDLTMMTSILEKMLGDAYLAFSKRDLQKTLDILRADSELDRLRNLVFMRHVENRENQPRQESFHVVFMTQTVERAGDHAKNLAEEVCQLVTGQAIRHLLRAKDKPYELLFVEWMRKQGK